MKTGEIDKAGGMPVPRRGTLPRRGTPTPERAAAGHCPNPALFEAEEHRYPPSAMVRDYATTGIGLALSLPPMVMLDLPVVVLGIFGLMSLCFATYGLGVVRRQRIRVVTGEAGLSFSPPSRRIAWDEITRFRLAWFSTRRDGARGWMELKIESRTATLRVDSRLDRFPELVGHVWRAVARQGMEPDPTTRANLDALGVAGEPGRAHEMPRTAGEDSATAPGKAGRGGREGADMTIGGRERTVGGRAGRSRERAADMAAGEPGGPAEDRT